MNNPNDPPAASSADSAFIGGGEMGKLVRAKDWARTPLGPIESWPPSLRTAVSLVLNSNFPISLAWGPQHVQIYNDGYWPICGVKHPASMGQDFSECWASAFPVVGDAFRSALAGTTAFLEDQRMFLDRLGYLEETFFTFSFSPIRDEHGAVAGLFHPVTETTGKMLAQRRTRTLRDLTAIGLEAKSLAEALQRSAQALTAAVLDVPFALFYRLDEDRRTARLVAQMGITPGGSACPSVVVLTHDGAGWPFAQVAASGAAAGVDDVRARFPGLVCGEYPEPIAAARVMPIATCGHEPAIGFMVVGVSTRLPMNEAYATFHDLLASTVSHVVASALAAEAERRRAEALAEIDRAKTEFFSNISHEFRTPLTLMLGPLAEELAERAAPLPAPRRERIETAHRNSLRLLKLVNTLLDFSRTEAGRVHANFQPADLAAFTAELASTFRSAIEQAGLTLTVDCAPLPEPVFVDREMWEKVVLNLLSNAFKHTFAGDIRVALRWCGDHVELDVADSGVGIPASELPLLFDRFHRVKGARSRTHEGTGIGLALVRELVQLHGGTVRVTSDEGAGSTFTATLKTGRAHLPAEPAASPSAPVEITPRAAAYYEEARQWISGEPAAPATAGVAGRARILWADDNADMREYVRRLLGEHYEVKAVSNGAEVVALAQATPPDLVPSDIMMPGLDGLGVLRELRADARTRHVPVILLSARAGEEEAMSGLESGADDYLVKPFSARELLARVRTHIALARLRREWAAEQTRTTELEQREAEGRTRLATSADSRRVLLGILEDQQKAADALRESEERYRTLFERAPDGIVVADAGGRYLDANPAICRMLGYTRDELLGLHASDIVAPAEIPHIDPALRETQAGADYQREWQLRRKDGSIFPVEVVATPMPNGNPMGMIRDITERKRAEQSLREAEARLRLSVAASNIGLWDWNLATNEVFYSREWKAQIGYAEGEMPNRFEEWESRVHPDDLAPTLAKVREFIANPVAEYAVEFRLRHKDGTYRWIFTQAQLFRDAEGKPVRMMGCHLDITERKRAEEALRENEQRLRSILDTMFVFVGLMNLDGEIVEVNHAPLEAAGLQRRDVLGRTVAESYWFSHSPAVQEQVRRALARAAQGEVMRDDYFIRIAGGRHLTIDTTFAPLRDASGRVTQIVGSAVDITERKRAEASLRESEERFAAAFRANPAGVVLSTLVEGRFLDVNPAFLRMFGLTREQVVGRTSVECGVVVSAEARHKIVEEVRRAGCLRDLEMPFQRPDGSTCHTLRSVERLVLGGKECLLTLIVDTTARKRAAEQLAEASEQLRALLARLQRAREEERIRVSREIHDELGQLLTGLKMDVRWLERKLSEPGVPAALNPLLERAVAASELADTTIATVQKIAAQLRPGTLDNLGLEAALQQKARSFQERTGVACALVTVAANPELPATVAGELFYICQEALTNVARHAHATKVEIHLRPEGEGIVLEVRDDGVGMAEAELHAPRSLGLLGMRERAVQCGGTVTFERNEPRGTCVTVRVPRANELAVSAKGADSYQPGATPQESERTGDKS